jgi:hypothetical protein
MNGVLVIDADVSNFRVEHGAVVGGRLLGCHVTIVVPRVYKTYDAVFDLTPAEFDAAFRQYAERRFGSVIR